MDNIWRIILIVLAGIVVIQLFRIDWNRVGAGVASLRLTEVFKYHSGHGVHQLTHV
jgi:hypothetical protein